MAQDGFQDFDNFQLHREIRTHWVEGSSGLLTCRIDKFEKTLFFENGTIQWAKSNDPTDHLHGVLVNGGFLTQNQLDSVSNGLKPGQIEGRDLVELGLITQQELKKGLGAVYFQIFSACMGARFGSYRFHSILPNIEVPRYPLTFPELYFKAILSIRDKRWLVSQFPRNLDFTWKNHPQNRTLDSGTLPTYFESAFEALNKIKDFRQLVFESGLDEFNLLKILYGLQLLGYLSVEAPDTQTQSESSGGSRSSQIRTNRKPAKRRYLFPREQPEKPAVPAQRRPTGPKRRPRQWIWLVIPLAMLAFFSILIVVTHTIARGSSTSQSPPGKPGAQGRNLQTENQNLKNPVPLKQNLPAPGVRPEPERQHETGPETLVLKSAPTVEKVPTAADSMSDTKSQKTPKLSPQKSPSAIPDPALYTLGIYLICQEENINKTLTALQSYEEVFLVPKSFEKRDCYWVCWGQFPSRWQALKTIPDLPDELQNYRKQMTPFLIEDLKK